MSNLFNEMMEESSEKDKKIADLEAKLENTEKEKELDNIFWKQECDSLQKTLAEKEFAHNSYFEKAEETIKFLQQQFNEKGKIEEQLEELKQQFAEKEKEIEELKQSKLIEDFGDAVLNFAIGNKSKLDLWNIIEQHTTKELVLEERIKELKQDKISFCIEKLNDMRSFVSDATEIKEPDYTKVCNYIDNQIKALKEMK